METSSARWRSERPPIVLDGEMRHTCKTLLTFTRPYFGTASSMSKTLAVSMYSGGSSSSTWMLARPAFRSRLSAARLVRISFARWSASMRWTRERSGAAVVGLVGVFVAGGMGGESTALRAADKGRWANIGPPEVEVHRCREITRITRAFAGVLPERQPGATERPDRAARSSRRTRAPAKGSRK